MRGTTPQERLAALSVHHNMNISENEIIDKFARMHPRRMQMIDILHSDITVDLKSKYTHELNRSFNSKCLCMNLLRITDFL